MAKRKPKTAPVAQRTFVLVAQDDLRTHLQRWRTHHDCGDHWPDFLEILLMTVADIQTQLAELAAKIAAIPPAPAVVASQADLDAISAQITTITASVPS